MKEDLFWQQALCALKQDHFFLQQQQRVYRSFVNVIPFFFSHAQRTRISLSGMALGVGILTRFPALEREPTWTGVRGESSAHTHEF